MLGLRFPHPPARVGDGSRGPRPIIDRIAGLTPGVAAVHLMN
jgi:hypothetical protein